MSPVDLAQVRAALALEGFDAVDAQRKMAPQPRVLRRSEKLVGSPRQASVMVLLYPLDEHLGMVLVQRSKNERDVHSGQIALPGGAREGDETAIETALRETGEELGVMAGVEIVGMLTPLYIPPSDFEVRPVVGYLRHRPAWIPDPAEVDGVVECPVDWLLDDDRKQVEDWDFGGYSLRVPWYDVHGHRVWGATAIMLSEFEQRLRRVIAG
jgi:8-oxo-dGTP pyrophosphatase MutT (NUDIX family)